MRVESVVKEWRMLLPNLVLFKDALLLELVSIVDCKERGQKLVWREKAKIAAHTYLLLRNDFTFYQL